MARQLIKGALREWVSPGAGYWQIIVQLRNPSGCPVA